MGKPTGIKAKCVKPASELIRHMRSAFASGYPTLNRVPEHDGEAVLCGSGPSLAEYLPDIKKHKEEGRMIVALKGTHDYLIENGVIPHIAMAVDPQARIADLYRKPHAGVRYYMSSQCHPRVFEALKDHHVVLWNVYTKSAMRYWQAREKGREIAFVNGGSTTGLRALTVAWVMGYRKLHLYGYDSCLRGKQLKVMGDTNQKEEVILVVDFRPFKCDAAMALQGYEFMPQLDTTPNLKVKAYGDGLIPWIVDRSARRDFKCCYLPWEDWSGDSPLRGSIPKYTEADIERLNEQFAALPEIAQVA